MKIDKKTIAFSYHNTKLFRIDEIEKILKLLLTIADVNDGDEIMATIEPGISLEDRVIVKAQVQVKNKTT